MSLYTSNFGCAYLPRGFGHQFCIILIGSGEYKLSVRKDLLCEESVFFRRALKGSSAEVAGNVIRFPEDNGPYSIAAFELFVSVLSFGNLPSAFTDCDDENAMRTLVYYYALIDRLLVGNGYKIEVLSLVLEKLRCCPSPVHSAAVADTLATTAENCPFRRLMLDLACVSYAYFGCDQTWFETCFKGTALGNVFECMEEVKEGVSKGTAEKMRSGYGIYQDGANIENIARYQIGFLKTDV